MELEVYRIKPFQNKVFTSEICVDDRFSRHNREKIACIYRDQFTGNVIFCDSFVNQSLCGRRSLLAPIDDFLIMDEALLIDFQTAESFINLIAQGEI